MTKGFRAMTLRLIIAFFIIICAVIVINIYLSQPVEADTYMGGNITASTTWDVSGSPYIVAQDINVNPGVNLSIEPGVVVKFNESIKMEVSGILHAIGNGSSPIVFTDNSEGPPSQSWNSGIHVNNGGQVIIERCEISETYYGLYLNGWTGNSKIVHTTFQNCDTALRVYGDSDIEINNIVLSNCNWGIYLYDTNNITIHNITVFNLTRGFYLLYSQNISISDCFVYDCSTGISLRESNGIIISNNEIFNNQCGVSLGSGTNDNRISSCNITFNVCGIRSEGRVCNISDCEITDNEDGVQLVNSRTNDIYNCTISRNSMYGIIVYSSSDMGHIIGCNISMNREGISMFGAKHGTFSHCTLWDNYNAIILEMLCEHNIIYRNDIISSYTGIEFSTRTRYNRIHHNNFIENYHQAKGPNNYLAIDNYWNASGEGNYWDDYDGRDLDGDNIGDSSYYPAKYAVDRFPLIFPYNGTIPPDTIPPYFIEVSSIASRNLTMPREALEIDFMSSEYGHYEIIIDTDGVGGFDNTSDTTLTNRTWAYPQTVHWTGMDNEGHYVVDGEYGVQIMLWDLNGNPMDEPFDLGMVNILVDRDSDGVLDVNDPFPEDPLEWLDSDGDGVGDNSDFLVNDPTQWSDRDGDGFGDNSSGTDPDEFPDDPTEWIDNDGDGIGDNSDTDLDNDGVSNDRDEYPLDPDEWSDMDGDGIGDNADPDDNNNDIPDLYEIPLAILLLLIPLLLFFILDKYAHAKRGDEK